MSTKPAVYLQYENSPAYDGRWISTIYGTQPVYDEIDYMKTLRPDANVEIADWENYGKIDLRGKSIDEICDLGELINEYEEDVVSDIAVAENYDAYQIRGMLEDTYAGSFESVEEFAREWLENSDECPDHLIPFIDFEMYADSLMDSYYAIEGDRLVHIFSN